MAGLATQCRTGTAASHGAGLRIGVVTGVDANGSWGWSPERQRHKWFQHTEDVWLDWIDRLPVGGFGRYPKDKWMAWSDAMIRRRRHGRRSQVI